MSKQIRVAQIIGKCSAGGVESVIMNLYRNIDHKEVIFDFFVENESIIINREEIESYGGSIKIIPKYTNIFKFKKALINIFKETKYDIVHSNMNAQNFIALRAAKKAGIKIRIAHSHTSSHKKDGFKHIIKSILRMFSKRNATHYFACSTLAGNWLFLKKVSKEKLYIIHNAINYEKFKFNEKNRDKIRNQLNVKPNEFLVGNIGRFVNQKNQVYLINIFKNFLESNKNAKLVIIGSGPNEKKIQKEIEKFKLNNSVKILKPVSNPNEYYSAFDCFILTSLYEGLPVVGIEAQASGLKCLFSSEITKEVDISGNIDFISLNDCGRWLEKLTDISREKISRDNLLFSDNFNIKKESARLLEIYKSLL